MEPLDTAVRAQLSSARVVHRAGGSCNRTIALVSGVQPSLVDFLAANRDSSASPNTPTTSRQPNRSTITPNQIRAMKTADRPTSANHARESHSRMQRAEMLPRTLFALLSTLIQRLCQGALNRPAHSGDSLMQCGFPDAESVGPFLHRHSHAAEFDHSIGAPVISLLARGGPSAIIRRVWTVYVDAVEGCPGRSRPDVSIEPHEVVAPFVADDDTAPAIQSKLRRSLVVAARLCAEPRHVFALVRSLDVHRLKRTAAAMSLVVTATAPAWAQTGTVAPVPIPTYFNATGQPCANCKLYTYAAGTSTPLATYSNVDLALIHVHANPIIMDSLGRPASSGNVLPIYLSPRGYKFELRTSGGTVLWTADSVLSVPTSDVASARQVAEGRLTLTSATPVTTGDVSAATTLYYTPYIGNRVALYDGASSWNVRTFTEVSIDLAACVISRPYDVFLYDVGGTVTGVLVPWASGTARGTPLVRQDGVWVFTGIPTYRYVGSVYCNATGGQTDDTAAKRYVWNYNNRTQRPLLKQDATASWTYSTATIRQARATTTNQVDVMVGLAEATLDLGVAVQATNGAGGMNISASIGEDSTTTTVTGFVGGWMPIGPAGGYANATGRLVKKPAIGRHVYAWLEYSDATGTTTWYGAAIGGGGASGLLGWIEG